MKKDNVILINFLGIMVFSIVAGVICGRLAFPLATGQIFMPHRIFLGPVLVIVSAFVIIFACRRPCARFLQRAAILACTGFGVILSGFCGFYTLDDIPVVVVSTVAFFFVVAIGVIIQYKNRVIFIHAIMEKMSILMLWLTVFVSVFVPIGPVPVLIAGVVWLASVF